MTSFTLPPIAHGFAELIAQLDGPRMMGAPARCSTAGPSIPARPRSCESLKYVEAEMKAYGFATDAHPARRLYQPAGRRVGAHRRRDLHLHHAFVLALLAAGGLSAPLVYVGAGDEAGFAGKDVRGCIVVVEGIANPGVVAPRVARRRGRPVAHQPAPIPARDVHLAGLGQSDARDRRGPALDRGRDRAARRRARRIKSLLAADAGLAATLTAEVDTGWRKTPILVADLRRRGRALRALQRPSRHLVLRRRWTMAAPTPP